MPTAQPSTSSSVARTGSSGSWANLSNLYVSDDTYATSNTLTPGVKTPIARLGGFAAVATPGLMTLRVERQADPDGAGGIPVVSDMVQLTLSGAPLGPEMTHGEGLPDADAIEEYVVDIAALAVTAPQLAAGALGVDLGWKHSMAAPYVYAHADWAVSVGWSLSYGAGAASGAASGTGNLTYHIGNYPAGPLLKSSSIDATVTITGAWIGAGSAPAGRLSFTRTVLASCGLSTPFFLGDSASLSLAVNDSVASSSSGAGTRSIQQTHTQVDSAPIVAGAASLTFNLSASGADANVSHSTEVASQVVANAMDVVGYTAPDPATVLVDSVQMVFAGAVGPPPPVLNDMGQFGEFPRLPWPTARDLR